MKKTGVFVSLFVLGMLVFFVGGYWAGIPYWSRTVAKIALPCLLLVATIACGRTGSSGQWRPVSLAFLAASCAFLVAWWVSDPLVKLFGFTPDSVSGVAFMKLLDAIPIVVTVILVARLGGVKPAELYLQTGKLKAWLIVGLVSFAAFTVLFLLQAHDQNLSANRLLAYAPWTLLFVFSNAFMEELHFRGLLLKPFERLLGRHPANLCIALFFTLSHAPVQYAPDILMFLAILFVLALAWGYIIQRTESLWGSVLFHAGADLMIIVGIYRTFGIR
jgi:membrane protease YdiL (CAAX protease family)